MLRVTVGISTSLLSASRMPRECHKQEGHFLQSCNSISILVILLLLITCELSLSVDDTGPPGPAPPPAPAPHRDLVLLLLQQNVTARQILTFQK